MYTESKDDFLDEDPVIPSQRIALLSILSPNTVNSVEGLDWTIKGIKIRGVFESEEAAQQRLKYLNKIDPYHHIFTAPVGRWCPWDDDESNAENIEYTGNDRLNQLMKKHREHSDKVKDHDMERKENARRNAIKQNKRLAKRAKKLEKEIGKTTTQIVADEIVSNDINTMHGMSREEMMERMKIIREERTNKAQERLDEKQEQIEAQKSTIDKLEEETRKVQEQLAMLK